MPEELILMLLNEENGYFHQVPGWQLNCAVAGAALAELSLLSRIDTDIVSLFLVDDTETGDPTLDPILEEIASEPGQHSAQYWVERLAPRAESVIDSTLDRLVELKVLEHHEGEFWTLARTVWQTELYGNAPYGLGTHTCLGSRWMTLQLAVNVLMIAHYFTIEVSPRTTDSALARSRR